MSMTFTDENIHEIIAGGQPVVVDFWATWCGPCKALAPTIDALAQEYEGRVIIGKYNTEDYTEFCTENRVMGIPLLLFFKNGEKAPFRLSGAVKADAIREKIEELLKM